MLLHKMAVVDYDEDRAWEAIDAALDAHDKLVDDIRSGRATDIPLRRYEPLKWPAPMDFYWRDTRTGRVRDKKGRFCSNDVWTHHTVWAFPQSNCFNWTLAAL